MVFEVPAELEKRMDEAISNYPVSKRSAVLPLLHLVQEHFRFISEEAVNWVAAKLSLEPVSYTHLDVYKRQEKLFNGTSSERGGDGLLQLPPARIGAQLIGAHLEKDEPEREQPTAGQNEAGGPLLQPEFKRTPGGKQGGLQPHPAHERPDQDDGADEDRAVEVARELRTLDFGQKPRQQTNVRKR